MQVFRAGGNAVDAGVAAGVTLGVVDKHFVELGGVAPGMVHAPGLRTPEVYDGIGRAPRCLDLDRYGRRRAEGTPRHVLDSVVPAALDSWLAMVQRHGRAPLSVVLDPARTLARDGFPVHRRLAAAIAEADRPQDGRTGLHPRLRDAAGAPLREGDLLVQPELADLLDEIVGSAAARGGDRAAGLSRARDEIYRGGIAGRLAEHLRGLGSDLDEEDLAVHRVELSEPVAIPLAGYELAVCGPWSQGPTLAVIMQLLSRRFDRHQVDDPGTWHDFLEAAKLAVADREGFMGDPAHVDVPIVGLTSEAYAEERVRALGSEAAQELPPPGPAWRYEDGSSREGFRPDLAALPRDAPPSRDTGYVCAMDAEGYALSATPSDDGVVGPVVEGLGLVLSRRGGQFWLDPAHPAGLAPGKRPRLTPNPAMLMGGGRAQMAFGTPGADAQCQAMAQVLVNLLWFDMGLQEAIDHPRVVTAGIPESAQPHRYRPAVALLESRHVAETFAALRRNGHRVEHLADFDPVAGGVSAVRRHSTGALEAAADPRRDGCALAW